MCHIPGLCNGAPSPSWALNGRIVQQKHHRVIACSCRRFGVSCATQLLIPSPWGAPSGPLPFGSYPACDNQSSVIDRINTLLYPNLPKSKLSSSQLCVCWWCHGGHQASSCVTRHIPDTSHICPPSLPPSCSGAGCPGPQRHSLPLSGAAHPQAPEAQARAAAAEQVRPGKWHSLR